MYSFGFITPTTGVIILVIILILFGPGKLPDIGRSLGKGIREFKGAAGDDGVKQLDEK